MWGNPVNSIEDANKSAKEFLNRGCSNVILTLGKMGSVFVSEAGINPIHIPAQEVKAVDSTVCINDFPSTFQCFRFLNFSWHKNQWFYQSNDL